MKTLKNHRLDRVMTIRELAKAAGVSPQTVVSLEVGNSARLGTLRKVAKALEVPVQEVEEFVALLDKRRGPTRPPRPATEGDGHERS